MIVIDVHPMFSKIVIFTKSITSWMIFLRVDTNIQLLWVSSRRSIRTWWRKPANIKFHIWIFNGFQIAWKRISKNNPVFFESHPLYAPYCRKKKISCSISFKQYPLSKESFIIEAWKRKQSSLCYPYSSWQDADRISKRTLTAAI